MQTPLIISTPSVIWQKIYLDVMFMPPAQGFQYIVAARDDLSRCSEGRALRNNTADAIAKFVWEEIFCQRGHFIIRESIVKACEGNLTRWPDKVAAAFFADKVTVSAATGCSPFYLLHGAHPVLPFDLTEATWMIRGYRAGLSTVDLLALRIRQLLKLPTDMERAARKLAHYRFQTKLQFEERFAKRLNREHFSPGELVLIRNTRVEKSLNRKALNRYFGPFVVHKRTSKGSYVLKELDGTNIRHGYAGFRLVPYIARDRLSLRQLGKDVLEEESEEEVLRQEGTEKRLEDDWTQSEEEGR
ncbi:uncharacterized protein STEHIDRAFT_51944 [Stereum hirsutum FP-91666 SS1]|uniref:uncharacterized protein n=1 Tax=Stereum hirsutum (strain FP-91666) TaxID=721885 RepID=UPI000440EB82|nr:uncharacterized protein STEHIDRAFT_51944 [Stereum hirsutum FP-91666 SS1]EIM89496.1 hypothetical protein STEHIDRAFT_51944 [Stereum hirsutum FP-91666 SS1]